MSVDSEPVETTDDVTLILEKDGVPISPLGTKPKAKWNPGRASAAVFGTVTPKSWVIVAIPERDIALIRRMAKPRPKRSNDDDEHYSYLKATTQ